MATQRWFADKNRTITDTSIVDAIELAESLWWVAVQVDFDSNNGESRTRVQSECVGGTPRFEVDREDD